MEFNTQFSLFWKELSQIPSFTQILTFASVLERYGGTGDYRSHCEDSWLSEQELQSERRGKEVSFLVVACSKP